MEGLRLIRNARPARRSRPMALVGAVATLLAALFLCFAPAGHADEGPVGSRVAADAPRVMEPHQDSRVSCPFDDRNCGLFPDLSPAVLTAPPLDPPLYAGGPAPLGQTYGPDRPGGAQPLPRAPDLHVLQVLRT